MLSQSRSKLGRADENQPSATIGMVCNLPLRFHSGINPSDLLAEDRRKSHELSRKIIRGRERNAAKRQASQQHQGPNAELPNESTDAGRRVAYDERVESDEQPSQTRGRSTQKRPLDSSKARAPQPKLRVRVHESNGAANAGDTPQIARSPTPGSTDVEPEEPQSATQETNGMFLFLFLFLFLCYSFSNGLYSRVAVHLRLRNARVRNTPPVCRRAAWWQLRRPGQRNPRQGG
jgi:hypothetical protein